MSVGFYSSASQSKGFAGFRRLLWLMSGVHMGCRVAGLMGSESLHTRFNVWGSEGF